MKPKKTFLIFSLILFFGLFLRGVNLSANPPALYGDELTLVYDTYSILKTGHDQLGNFLPLTFPMGAARPGGYIYFSLPFVSIFGPTALGIRALSFLSGMGIIIFIFLITRKIFSTKIALASAFLTSISIWDISLSRGGFEAHFALFLALLGIYALIKAAEKPTFYLISAISLGLTLHTYPTYKLTLILFLPLLIWFLGKEKVISDAGIKYKLLSVLILISLIFLSVLQTFMSGSEQRFSQINLFSNPALRETIIQKVNYERSLTNQPSDLAKLFHNKPVEYGKIIGENYLKNFSTDFLFIHGDRNPRHNMVTMGQLYIADIILLIFAALFIRNRGLKIVTFLFSWVGIGALGSVLINEPHALRNSFMLPPLLMFSGFGLISLWENTKGTRGLILKGVFSVILLIQFIFFIQKLFFLAPNEYSRFWSYPAKIASEMALSEKENFDYVFISDKIDNVEYAYPVYTKTDPNILISQNEQRENLLGYELKKIDNVYIGNLTLDNIDLLFEKIAGSALFIGVANEKINKDQTILESLDKETGIILHSK